MAEYVKATLAELPANASVPVGSKGWVMTGDKIYEWDGDSWVLKSIGGAALVSDGIVGIEYNCVHGSALGATPVRVKFPSGTTRVIIKPAGTGSMKVAMNAPDTASETTTAAGAAWLAQADNKNINMMFRRITAGGPVEDAEIINMAGIECLDFTGDATISSVAFNAVVGG